MKDPLRKDFIAVSGDLGEERSHEKIKRWIEVNGGRYETSITDRTTHLICSEKHWKRQARMVVAARKSKHVKIVSFDWLEDSLQNQTHKREGAYLWKKIIERKQIKKARRRQRERKGERDDSMSPSPQPPSRRQSTMRDFLKSLAGTDKTSSTAGKKHKSKSKSKAKDNDNHELKQQPLTFERNEHTSAVEALAARRAAKKARQEAEAEAEPTLGTPFESPPGSQKAIEINDDESSQATLSEDENVAIHMPPEAPKASQYFPQTPQPKSIRHALAEAIRSIGGTPPKSLLRDRTTSGTSSHAAAIPSSSSSSSTFTPSPSTFSLAPKRALSHLLPRRASTEEILAGNHHIYHDATGFGYNILLTRADFRHNKIERVVVRLYETHTLPASYAVFERYTAPGKDAIEEVACPIGSPFVEAFGVFRKVFGKWAEVRWEDRQLPPPAMKGENEAKNGKGKEGTGVEKPFRYIRPKEGMPTGVEMWHGVTREEKVERELDEEFAGL